MAESYCYLPLLEELGYMPKEKYSYAPEIYEHSQRIGKAFDLYDKACFQTKVEEIVWQEETSTWLITTDREDAMQARFVVMACGPLNRPKLPAVKVSKRRSHTFILRAGIMITPAVITTEIYMLADKRVGVIGTGATAIQSVPFVGEHAKELYVFHAILCGFRGNSPTDPEWVETLEPGWQRERRETLTTFYSTCLLKRTWLMMVGQRFFGI